MHAISRDLACTAPLECMKTPSVGWRTYLECESLLSLCRLGSLLPAPARRESRDGRGFWVRSKLPRGTEPASRRTPYSRETRRFGTNRLQTALALMDSGVVGQLADFGDSGCHGSYSPWCLVRACHTRGEYDPWHPNGHTSRHHPGIHH